MADCDQAEISFELDESIYSLDAVQNAAYVFTGRAYVRVDRGEAGRIKVLMTAKAGLPAEARVELRGEFDNELIHQVLRLRVSAANQKIREFIVTKALVSAQPAALVSASTTAAADAPCPECAEAPGAPPPPQIDAALEKEIDRLLAEIESGDGAADPLGVSVPWEEAFGPKGKGKAPEPAPKAKPPKTKTRAKRS